MSIVQIAPATRRGMKLLINLYGMSETGKTLSALKLATGIEPDPSKRGLLDTEGGQRGRAYVDHVPGGYMYGALPPPFTPERYIQALGDFEAAGVTTLVIDSGSHIWMAEGGILDLVEQSGVKNDLGKWIEPKRRLRKFVNRLLSADMHIIVCSRAKQPLVAGPDKKLVPGPVVAVQEKNLRYDFTIIAHMLGDGHFSISREDGGKCPGTLRDIFAAGEKMDEAMGRKLIQWIGGIEAKTPAQRRLEADATDAADRGSEAFRAFWKGLASDQRAHLQNRIGDYQSAAQAADQEAEQRRREATDADVPDDPLGVAQASSAPIAIGRADEAVATPDYPPPPSDLWDSPTYDLPGADFVPRMCGAIEAAPSFDALTKLADDNKARMSKLESDDLAHVRRVFAARDKALLEAA